MSYRRTDDANFTGRFHDKLIGVFGDANVFRDIDSIPAGTKFEDVINARLADVDAVVALIGPTWDARIGSPSDFVRMEIAHALQSDTPVIPVLIEDTPLPTPDGLPDDLKPMLDRQTVRVRRDPDFHRDAARVIDGVREAVIVQRERQAAAAQSGGGGGAQPSASKRSVVRPRSPDARSWKPSSLERNALAEEERRAAEALAAERSHRLAELARLEEEATQRRIADERGACRPDRRVPGARANARPTRPRHAPPTCDASSTVCDQLAPDRDRRPRSSRDAVATGGRGRDCDVDEPSPSRAEVRRRDEPALVDVPVDWAESPHPVQSAHRPPGRGRHRRRAPHARPTGRAGVRQRLASRGDRRRPAARRDGIRGAGAVRQGRLLERLRRRPLVNRHPGGRAHSRLAAAVPRLLLRAQCAGGHGRHLDRLSRVSRASPIRAASWYDDDYDTTFPTNMVFIAILLRCGLVHVPARSPLAAPASSTRRRAICRSPPRVARSSRSCCMSSSRSTGMRPARSCSSSLAVSVWHGDPQPATQSGSDDPARDVGGRDVVRIPHVRDRATTTSAKAVHERRDRGCRPDRRRALAHPPRATARRMPT